MQRSRTVLSLCAASILLLTACPQPNTSETPNPGPSGAASTEPTPAPSGEPGASPSSEPGANPEPGSTATPSPAASGTIPITAPSGAPVVDISEIASIEVSVPNPYLKKGKGDTAQLSVTLKDKDGQVVSIGDAVLDWVSARPNDFSIDANGLATALVSDGYTIVTVTEKSSGLSATLKLSVTDTRSSGGGGGGGGSSFIKKTPPDNLTANVDYNDLGRRQFHANMTTSSNDAPHVAADAAGDYVVVWQENTEIMGQRYLPNGVPNGPQFQVNTYSTSIQAYPRVAMDAAGDFVVSWSSKDQDGDGFGVFAQRYNSMGDRMGLEWQVNTTTTDDQRGSDVAMDADGNFVVTWESHDGTYAEVQAQRYASDGTAVGSEFTVNANITYDNNSAAVSMDAAGDFVVAWQVYTDGEYADVYARRYNSAGVAQGTEFPVNNYTQDAQEYVSVAMDQGGDFVVAWSSYYQASDYSDIYARRYNSAGTAQGSEFRVNTVTNNGWHYSSSVALDATGDFVIGWALYDYGNTNAASAQRYDSAGVAQGAEVQLNADSGNTVERYFVNLAMDSSGNFVAVWLDRDATDINVRQFNSYEQAR